MIYSKLLAISFLMLASCLIQAYGQTQLSKGSENYPRALSFFKEVNKNIYTIKVLEKKKLNDNYSVVSIRGTSERTSGLNITELLKQELFGFFIVNSSSNQVYKTIDIFPSGRFWDYSVTIVETGSDYLIAEMQGATYGDGYRKEKYFFDIYSESPVQKYTIHPVSIHSIEHFGTNMFLAGTIGKNGVIIKLGLENGNISEKNNEIITIPGEEKISPISLAKIENGVLKMYSRDKIYTFEGRKWSKTNGMDIKYFRPERDPCTLIPFEKLVTPSAQLAGYKKCGKERHRQGDAWRVGYSGKCEIENSDKYGHLPDSYIGTFTRYALLSNIINISTSPPHKFFIWNNEEIYPHGKDRYGIYEIENKKCRFYPFPPVTNDLLKRFRPKQYCSMLDTKMGAFQKLDDNIWFCPDFYDGEGSCGVGGVGYFNLKEKKYNITYSTQIAAYGCSAIMAEKEKVWVGLTHQPEGATSPQGLAVLNTVTNDIALYEIPSIINIIKRVGDSIILGCNDGIYILGANGKTSFWSLGINKNGEYQISPRSE